MLGKYIIYELLFLLVEIEYIYGISISDICYVITMLLLILIIFILKVKYEKKILKGMKKGKIKMLFKIFLIGKGYNKGKNKNSILLTKRKEKNKKKRVSAK